MRERKTKMKGRVLAILLSVMMVVFAIPDIGMNGGVHAMVTSGQDMKSLSWEWNDEVTPKTLTIDLYPDSRFLDCMMAGEKKSDYAWNDYRGEIEKLVIKKGVASIGSEAFMDCSKINTIVFPEGNNNNNNLSFRENSFKNCTSLKSISFPSYAYAYGRAFEGSGLKKIEFAVNCVSPWNYAFANCSDLEEVVFEGKGRDHESGIGEGVFYNCIKLKNVQLPTNMDYILVSAFENCKSLESITLPATTREIRDKAFSGCEELKSINLSGALLTGLGEEAFKGCKELETVTISDSVTKIGQNCFEGCSKLKMVVAAPSAAYEYAKSSGIPYTIQNGGKLSETVEWYVDKKTNELVVLGAGSIPDYESTAPWYENYKDKITKIIVSDGITKIGKNAFYGLKNVTEVSLGNSVKEIGDNAFSACLGIKNVDIPVKVEKIGNGAFEDCSSIEKISIPANTSSIGDKAFNGCSSLGDVNIPANVTTIGKDAFKNTSKNTRIITEDGSAAADYAAANAITCTSKTSKELKAEEEAKKKAEEEAKKKAEEAAKKKSDDKKTTQTTTTDTSKEATKKGTVITDGKFSYKVTKTGTAGKTVGAVTLTKSKNKNIKKVVIGSTVKIDGITYKITAIGNGAFKGNKKITSVTIGANVLTISNNAFAGCTKLNTIMLKTTKLQKIGANAFKGINKKATISVPKAKKKAYIKLLKGKGQAKTVKIK